MARPEATEKPTPKRRQEARKKGQVPRSAELPGSVIFLAGIFIIYGFFPHILDGVQSSVRSAFFHVTPVQEPTIRSAWLMLFQAVAPMLAFLGTLFAAAFVIGIVVNIAQFGFLFSLQAIKPSFSKLNPITGIQRMFSKQIAVNLLKQLAKLAAVLIILYQTIAGNLGLFAQVGQTQPLEFVQLVAAVVFPVAWKYALLLVVVGIADYAWQRYQLEDSLKMTKTEIKDEARQAEGNPEAKGALKKKQREFARRRMMAAVPRATVVVTNPTHFAVALEWNELEMDAPVVIAKGADLLAKRIRELATEHRIPIMENPPLARTLYERVELDHPIPPNLYAAVAQVIAFVFRLKRKTIA
ncbi:MAG: flagellar biosynthesis protein FlhB [Candidatus Eremiobacteraeota bacterium]|nr:flagellar biosynthesis protein FlhB [Candidatus Eremiobacteraeota bacterium]